MQPVRIVKAGYATLEYVADTERNIYLSKSLGKALHGFRFRESAQGGGISYRQKAFFSYWIAKQEQENREKAKLMFIQGLPAHGYIIDGNFRLDLPETKLDVSALKLGSVTTKNLIRGKLK